MATTTNYGWTTPDDTALVKDGAAAIRTLGSSVDTTVKALSPGTTSGDLDYYTSATTKARLAKGTASQVLAMNSGATAPEWVTPTSGGMTLISETVASAATGINFSSIPATYKQLMLVWSGTQHSATGSTFGLRINNNSGSLYVDDYITTSASSVSASGGVGTSVGDNSGIYPFGVNNDAGATIQFNSKGFFVLDNYASATKLKTYNIQFFYRNVGSSTYINYTGKGLFNSTAAVTSLDIVRTAGTSTLSNITNSTIRLYGIS